MALVKPQFEAGREKVGKKGVVREQKTHREVIHKVVGHACSIGFEIKEIDYSPIKGPEGNIEYLLHMKKGAAKAAGPGTDIDLDAVVDLAFGALA